MKDKEETFDRTRDFIEYNASFMEPEVVRKVKDAREKSVNVDTDSFNEGLERLFGRRLDEKKTNK
jgi:poly(3-hydroxyalkanoate) synthetase